jgi:hypothetical protein
MLIFDGKICSRFSRPALEKLGAFFRSRALSPPHKRLMIINLGTENMVRTLLDSRSNPENHSHDPGRIRRFSRKNRCGLKGKNAGSGSDPDQENRGERGNLI